MAGEKNSKSATASPRTPGGRTTPVLVPQGALAGQPDIPLDRPVTTVGANENARLHLVSRTVSKGHAIFVNTGGSTYVADMASRTGVLVNGKLVKDAELKTGDRVQIGKFVFRYRSPASTAPPAPQPQSPAAAVIVVGSPAVATKGRTVIIGRRETSDIAIPGDAGVSAAHAVIFQMDGRWYLRDLASRTGTKVNGNAIHQQELKFGDRIVVGSTNVLFQPGASAKAVDAEDSFAPDIPVDLEDELPADELPADELPVDEMSGFEPAAVAEAPTTEPEAIPVEASDTDDAIPLGDWRSGIAAEPVDATADTETETDADAPLELEEVLEPIAAEPEAPPVEVAEEITESPAAPVELPVAVEADDDVFALADESPAPAAVDEPVAVEPEATDEFALVEDAAPAASETVFDIPIEEEPALEPLAIESAEPEIEFAAEASPAAPPAAPLNEPEPVAVVEPVAEPIEVAEIDEEPVAVAEEPAAVPEPVAVSTPVESVEPELPVYEEAVEAVAEPEPPAPVAAEPIAKAAPPPPPPAPAKAPPTVVAAPVVEHLLGDVEDFVFVPAEERVDPNAVPDVIFWGDPEVDSVTETVETQPAPAKVVPPAAQDKQPPADADDDSPGDDGPSGPPSPPPPPASPLDSTDSLTEPVNGESEESTPPVHTEYSAVAEIVPDHYGEPAVALDELPPLDVTEVAATDVPVASVVDAQAVFQSVEPGDAHLSVAGYGLADLNAVLNVDRVEADAPSAEPSADLSDAVVDDHDEFFTPLSPALENAFNAARAWNQAPADEDAATFDVIEPFRPQAQGSWESEASPLAVDLLEPHETLPPSDANPDVEHFHIAANEPVDTVESVERSAVLNTDWVEPAFATTAAQDATIAAADLDLPEITAAEPADWSATINVDLEPSITVAVSVQPEPVNASAQLDLPELTAIAPESNAAGEMALDTAIVEAPAPITADSIAPFDAEVTADEVEFNPAVSTGDEIDLADAESPAAEFTAPITGHLDVELDAPSEVSALSVEESDSIPQEQLDLPDFGDVEPDANVPIDEELTTETAEFEPSIASDDELEFAEPADIAGTVSEQVEIPDFDDADPAVEAAIPTGTITETPPTIDFAGLVSAAAEAPVEEPITLPEAPAASTEVAADIVAEFAQDPTSESDLDFLDFGDSEIPEPRPVAEQPPMVAPAPSAESPAGETPAIAPKEPEAPAAARKGPSLFGFEFEGGSFLGGMPISLADKSAIPKPPTASAPPAASPTFDARATAPSGLGSMVAPVAAPVQAQPQQPVQTQQASQQPRAEAQVPPVASPPRPGGRPTVAPPAGRAPGSVTSLTGLISEARSASGPPVIPPVVKAIAGNTAAAGVGLTGNTTAAGLASRSVEVFSQLNVPIGVEVFGGRPGNPDQFNVPDIKETTEIDLPAEESTTEPQTDAQADSQPEYAAETAPVTNVRWWRVPLWVSLMILTPAIAWVVVPRVISESSTFTGGLAFTGLKEQQPVDLHEFVKSQESLLCGSNSEEIRKKAKEILRKDGNPAGFTDTPASYAQTVETQNLNWSDDQVQFTLHWPNERMAKAQVDAVLLALAEKDQDLVEAKNQARITSDAAKAKLDAINAELAKLTTEHQTQAAKASEKPDAVSVNQNHQDVIGLTDQFNSAHAVRVASESVLKDLKAQDPSKPIDPDSDKEIVDLKKRLDLLNEQIRLAKSKGGVSAASGTGAGTDVGVGATTQPDSAADPLLKAMQEQADTWSGKIQRRRDELAALAAIPADQRAVNLSSAIENLSIKITGLQKSEDDLKAQLDEATLKQSQYQKQTEDSNLAEVHKNELYRGIQEKDAEKQTAVENAQRLETAYGNAITVAAQQPARFISVTNLRRTALMVISILAALIFGRLTLGELLRPRIMTSRRPNAAPLVNPPMRVIPWPEAHQLQGLKGDRA